MSKLQNAPRWQQEQALVLHDQFSRAALNIKVGATQTSEMARISNALASKVITERNAKGHVTKEKPLKRHPSSVLRLYKQWQEGGRRLEALLPNYHSAGHHTPMPTELTAEIQRRASHGRGGRKANGTANKSEIYKDLARDWRDGKNITGIGTWEDWWLRSPATRDLPLPEQTPEFPWSAKTVSRHCGSDAQRDVGNRGLAAAKNKFSRLSRDYSQLRKAELFQLDDVYLDLVVIDKLTGRAVRPLCYVMIETGSRFIPAYSFICGGRPRARAADVKELICRGLTVTGIGDGYVSHLFFERGHIACSDDLQTILEGLTEGAVKVHRTSMIENVKWVGAAPDQVTGNSAGKSVIESFNARLHALLGRYTGQLGNAYQNADSSIGLSHRDDLKGRLSRRRSTNPDDKRRKAVSKRVQVELDEAIAQGKANLALQNIDANIVPGLYYAEELNQLVSQAIDEHNNDPGHAYQGHHRITEIETAPNVWERA